jgi:hypothetical protein
MIDGTGRLAMKNYTADDYKRMLINVIDANYGTSWHDIGNGDGMPPKEAAEIAEFWHDYLDAGDTSD